MIKQKHGEYTEQTRTRYREDTRHRMDQTIAENKKTIQKKQEKTKSATKYLEKTLENNTSPEYI